MGNRELIDGVLHDGLTDVYSKHHMGLCAEQSASDFRITRLEQDNFAIGSYQRTADSWKRKLYAHEIVPVTVVDRKGEKVIDTDEEYSAMYLSKIPSLKPVFKTGGTVTVGNSSKLNDGASAMVVVSGKVCRELGLEPLFRIRGMGDAELEPQRFCEAPAAAIPKAAVNAGIALGDIDLHDVNEAFSVVPLVTARY
jgi:acetyl-CoA C-acetyltransferase